MTTSNRLSIAKSMALQYFDHSDEILKNVLNALERTNTMCEVFASAKNIHKDEISERDFAKILKNGTIKPLTELLNEEKNERRNSITLSEVIKRDRKKRPEGADCALSDVAIAGSHVGSLRSDDLTSLRSDDFEDNTKHVENGGDDDDWGDDDAFGMDELDTKKKIDNDDWGDDEDFGDDDGAATTNDKKDEEDWGDDDDFASSDHENTHQEGKKKEEEDWGDDVEDDDWGDEDFEPTSNNNIEDNVDEFSETESLPATGAVDIKQFSALRIAADAELLTRLQNEVAQLRQENLKLRENSPIKN